MADKAIVTCALTGVLTNPAKHPVPVTPEEMAEAAWQAWNEGATIVHCHFRNQEPGLGYLPSWDPAVATAICDAIRARCPELLINMSTGVMGDDTSGPEACLRAVRPETAALNAGSLNYLRLRSNGDWAWPPMLFDNQVSKIERMLETMRSVGAVPECECFDTGIVRSVAMFARRGMLPQPTHLSLVMGVASGMPARREWLPLLVDEMPEGAHWQTIAIGREEVWDVHRGAVELGGHVRTGLEDTFYLPDGSRASNNGALVRALVSIVREAGREPTTAAETRALLGVDAAQSAADA